MACKARGVASKWRPLRLDTCGKRQRLKGVAYWARDTPGELEAKGSDSLCPLYPLRHRDHNNKHAQNRNLSQISLQVGVGIGLNSGQRHISKNFKVASGKFFKRQLVFPLHPLLPPPTLECKCNSWSSRSHLGLRRKF